MNRGTMVIANGVVLLLLICAGCASPEVRTDARRTAPVKQTLTYDALSDEQRVTVFAKRAAEMGGYDATGLALVTSIADRGNAEAQYLVGMIWKYPDWRAPGEELRTNHERAHASFLKAAKQGHAEAAFEVAKGFLLGRGVKEDEGEALRWYEAAAEHNHARAQYLAGLLYFRRGEITHSERDVFKGIDWLQKSARNGEDDAKKILDRIGVPADDAAVTASGATVDLTIDSVSYEPKSISRHSPTKVTITGITRNLGTRPSGLISYSLFLSRDNVLNPLEDSLIVARYGLGLAGGGQRTEAIPWVTPEPGVIDIDRRSPPSPGAYHVIVVVDSLQKISETDESNNVYVSPAADFVVE